MKRALNVIRGLEGFTLFSAVAAVVACMVCSIVLQTQHLSTSPQGAWAWWWLAGSGYLLAALVIADFVLLGRIHAAEGMAK